MPSTTASRRRPIAAGRIPPVLLAAFAWVFLVLPLLAPMAGGPQDGLVRGAVAQPALEQAESAAREAGERAAEIGSDTVEELKERAPTELEVDEAIAWLLLGGLAGCVAGALVTFRRQGFGVWRNIGLGAIGAFFGGLVVDVFSIDFDLGEVTFSYEEIVASIVAAVVLVLGYRIASARIKKAREQRQQQKASKPAG